MYVAKRLEAPLRRQAVATRDRSHTTVVYVVLEARDDEVRQERSVVLGEPNHRACGLDRRIARQLTQPIGEGFIVAMLQAQHNDAAARTVLVRADDCARDRA